MHESSANNHQGMAGEPSIPEKYESYVNAGMSRLFRVMGLEAVEERARGVYLYDDQGNEYLDFLGGYGSLSLGHSHPQVVQAVKSQLDKMSLSSKVLFSGPMANLAEKLAEITPGSLQYSFFCNSGAEAVEGAIKLARLATGRKGIIAAQNGFHGKTLGALSVTGREVFRQPCEPLLPGVQYVPFGDIQAMEQVINQDIAGVLLEPIQGEGGVILPPEDYLAQVRQLCDQNGTLLILDEVQTGLGRTGTMFACEHYGVEPDIMTLAKALGGGVMPIGAFVATPQVWTPLEESPFLHTSTFGGNPLACVAALTTLQVLTEQRMADKAKGLGSWLLEELQHLKCLYPKVISEVRGKGLLIGLELASEGLGGALMAEMFDAHILVAYTLNQPRVLRIEPPLVVGVGEIIKLLTVLKAALDKVASYAEEF